MNHLQRCHSKALPALTLHLISRHYPGDLQISRVLCDKSRALTEEPGVDKNLQQMNGEFRIGTRPTEKCMTVLAELKSPNSVTDRNANIRATDAKYSDCSCTDPRQQPLEENAQETVRGEVIQKIDLVGDYTEDVDTDLLRESMCLMHNMANHSVVALSGTPISMTSGEGPSMPMTWQTAGAWVPLQEPARDITVPILQISPRDAPVPRP